MAVRDPDDAHPVPEEWRSILGRIVGGFVDGDYRLTGLGAPVDPVDDATATRIEDYVADYGETLVELPEEVWDHAEASWCGGDLWEVLVDLWTTGEGQSDMVLRVLVVDDGDIQQVAVKSVYVP